MTAMNARDTETQLRIFLSGALAKSQTSNATMPEKEALCIRVRNINIPGLENSIGEAAMTLLGIRKPKSRPRSKKEEKYSSRVSLSGIDTRAVKQRRPFHRNGRSRKPRHRNTMT
ncbi:MAG: hypothetical protein LBU37_00075 [Tannerellaceae bacterium]|nr:hypothetical protein [Tannerellaceae bacterium]